MEEQDKETSGDLSGEQARSKSTQRKRRTAALLTAAVLVVLLCLCAVLLLVSSLFADCGEAAVSSSLAHRGKTQVSSETNAFSGEETAPAVLSIGLQESLDMENPEAAAELVKAVTLRLDALSTTDLWSGTAVVWDQTDEDVILVTSAHLLEHEAEELAAVFGQEEVRTCWILGVSAQVDVGFVSFSKEAVTAEVLAKLRCVRLHQRTYDTLIAGDICFAVGCSPEGVADENRQLIFSQEDFTEESVGEGLFLFDGACEAGMSGSGVFDGYGHFIGMAVAIDETRTLAVPMEMVNAAAREILGYGRDTRNYSE